MTNSGTNAAARECEVSGAAGGKAGELDFFVSRRGSQAAVAQEIADVLRDAGYTVILQDTDIPYASEFVTKIDDALRRCRHLVVVLSKDYNASGYTMMEVTNFLAARARSPGERRLVVLRTEDCFPEGVLAESVFGDLVGVEDKIKRRDLILATARGQSFAVPKRPKIFGKDVPGVDKNFIGRSDVLDRLHGLLLDPVKAKSVTQAAIHGLPGIGKTAIAAEYCNRFADQYSGVWWAPAQHKPVLISNLARLAGRLDERLAEEPDEEKAARAALERLARFDPPFLLVYDNVETPATITDLVPANGVRVLMTTQWSAWDGRTEVLKLDALASEVAVAMLQQRAGRSDVSNALRLVEALGRLPLAIDHAGAYCKHSDSSFDDYLDEVSELIHELPPGTAYPKSVGATFKLAIERASNDSAGAENLLGLAAFFAAEHIPEYLVADEAASSRERAKSRMALSEVSLVEFGLVEGERTFTIHRLVQAAMRRRLADREDSTTALLALRRLREAFPEDAYAQPRLWSRCAALMPHLLAVRGNQLVSQDAAPIQSRLYASGAAYQRGRGGYNQAVELYQHAIEIGAQVHGRGHETLVRPLFQFATVLGELNRNAEAEKLAREALAAAARHFGRDSLTFASGLNDLAFLLEDSGKIAQAEQHFRDAISIGEKCAGSNAPEVTKWKGNLGALLQSNGRLQEAEPLLRIAIDHGEKTLGRGHPSVTVRLGNFATLLEHTGRIGEAEALYREVISTGERTLGAEHPHVAVWLNSLGLLLADAGQFAEAEALIRRAIAITEKESGRNHDVAVWLNNLACILQDVGRAQEAERLFRQAIAIWSAEPSNPSRARAERHLAKLLVLGGRAEAALPLVERSLAVTELRYGREHIWTTDAAVTYADALAALGRTDAAAKLRASYALSDGRKD